jgi:hypothetical protein
MAKPPRVLRRGQFQDAKILLKFIRGFYIHEPTIDMRALSQKICSRSYISLESVLADNLVIGSIPRGHVMAVKLGVPRLYQGANITIEHLRIREPLFWGFEPKSAVLVADPEKALLDCVYFYVLGCPLMFSPYEDVNFDRLDIAKIRKYLLCYKNEKFISFVTRLLDEHR